MSASSSTTNLGLPVYTSQDKPSWLDTNHGFEEIDAKIAELQTAIASVQEITSQLTQNGYISTGGNGLTVAQYGTLKNN